MKARFIPCGKYLCLNKLNFYAAVARPLSIRDDCWFDLDVHLLMLNSSMVISVTRLGDFLNFLVTFFLQKQPKIFETMFGLF